MADLRPRSVARLSRIASLVALALWLWPSPGSAATCAATDITTFDSCLSSTSNGDTITIADGAYSLTGTRTISKALTIIGLSTTTMDGNGRTTACGATFTDNSASSVVFTVNLVANLVTRWSGICFAAGTGTSGYLFHGNGLNSDNRRLRIDHVASAGLAKSFVDLNTVLGVLDHSTITSASGVTAFVGYVKNSSWNQTQGSDQFGDDAWADSAACAFGTDKFFFYEDNNFVAFNDGAHHLTVTDGQAGGCYVMRYSTLTRAVVDGHGREASRERSSKAFEVYNNTFVGADFGSVMVYIRGGTGLVHDNTGSGYQANNAPFQLLSFWETQPVSPWGEADGTNTWDKNDASSPFATGALTACSGTSVTTNQNFTLNQYANYVIKRTSNGGSLSTNISASIVSNTAGANSVLTVRSASGGTQMGCTSGDTFQINKVTHGMDQIGRTGGSNLNGVASPSVPGGWNDQTTAAWYEWTNTRESSTNISFGTSYGTIIAGTHYNNDTTYAYTTYTYPHPLVTCGAVTCGQTQGGVPVYRYRAPGEDE